MRHIFSPLTIFVVLCYLKQVKSNAQDNGPFLETVNVRNVADQEESYSTDMDFSWQIVASLEDMPMEDETASEIELPSEAQLESRNSNISAENSKAHVDHPLKFETMDNFYKWNLSLSNVTFQITASFDRFSNQPIIEFATNATADGQSTVNASNSLSEELVQIGEFQVVNKSTPESENIEFYYCGKDIAAYYHSRSTQSLFHSEFFGIEIDVGIMKFVSILSNSTCYCHFLLDNGESIYIMFDEKDKALNVEIASTLRVKLKGFKGFFARKTYGKGNVILKMDGKMMITFMKNLKSYKIDSNLLYFFPMQT